MKIASRAVHLVIGFLAGVILVSCASAPAVPTSWTSDPVVQTNTNVRFTASIEPLKKEKTYYYAFQLTFENNTEKPLFIDWTRTRYIHDGKSKGQLWYEGITPEQVKAKTFPQQEVAPGQRITKLLVPIKLLAYGLPRYSTAEDKSAIQAGSMPAGENGVYLAVRSQEDEGAVALTVVISGQP